MRWLMGLLYTGRERTCGQIVIIIRSVCSLTFLFLSFSSARAWSRFPCFHQKIRFIRISLVCPIICKSRNKPATRADHRRPPQTTADHLRPSAFAPQQFPISIESTVTTTTATTQTFQIRILESNLSTLHFCYTTSPLYRPDRRHSHAQLRPSFLNHPRRFCQQYRIYEPLSALPVRCQGFAIGKTLTLPVPATLTYCGRLLFSR
jgi:hypothetical protein